MFFPYVNYFELHLCLNSVLQINLPILLTNISLNLLIFTYDTNLLKTIC